MVITSSQKKSQVKVRGTSVALCFESYYKHLTRVTQFL